MDHNGAYHDEDGKRKDMNDNTQRSNTRKNPSRPLMAFTGGGSGGHVFPALGVLDELGSDFSRKYRLIWLGSSGGIEERIVTEQGINFKGLPAGKLRRYLSLRNLFDALKFFSGIVLALLYFLKNRPVLLFSKGGFVSVAPVIAAGLLGIPVISHESDVDPGLATRINRRFTKVQCIPFPESARFYPAGLRVETTGNPVRKDILRGERSQGLKIAGFDGTRPVLLVQGGSLGARQINSFIREHREELLAHMDIIHQTGEKDSQRLSSTEDFQGYFARPFFSREYPHILAAADLVLSRSGAGSLWELGITGKPSFFIPLTEGARGDQMRNARYAEERGVARVFHQKDPGCKGLDELAGALITAAGDAELRKTMALPWSEVVHPHGGRNIAEIVREFLPEEEV
ncbi:UDP-N-acetylglucosamine-N-acetylmuramyl- (pentapeptide) pyrophosphoryl-undecaprenol N-acetylglucosamine transferase [Salinispira pacifica]|uniref:UDP-N-acetylglucosamine--N-acetylmuramyl-(pentapeptide) pyrophosphoryl-undecaprenol N-acetylglucosamine transferase n=2 Tax=Salinispira pacifica TaxID=1307761 RepID=V5WEU1_9SPIO|nr:UDP-N-acetylglucosamine-N-acetylmuramyl- (pentapeptide) pyrophosphoryl-undecaprenol N-acetylglucosamine transferase [Salinispira pacifica]